MDCKNCGNSLPDDASVCPYCAEPVETVVEDYSQRPSEKGKNKIVKIVLGAVVGVVMLAVAALLAIVVLAILEHLRCARLASYMHDIALCFAHFPWIDGGGAQVIIPNHIVQTSLDVAQCIAVAQSMFDYFALELLDDFIVLTNLGDQHG